MNLKRERSDEKKTKKFRIEAFRFPNPPLVTESIQMIVTVPISYKSIMIARIGQINSVFLQLMVEWSVRNKCNNTCGDTTSHPKSRHSPKKK